MKTMKLWRIAFMMLAAFSLASCKPSARQTAADVEPDKYDFERGQIYRIVKEFFKSGQNNPQSVYCNFTIE